MTWLRLAMDDVPAELRALPWIGWRAERHDDDGDWKKLPYQIGEPRRLASNADPMHWGIEGDVREVRALAPDLFDGFGVVLTAAAGITFVDLDGVRDPDSGVIEPWALRLINVFDSWTEISVSGTGVHIFVRARLPGAGVVGYLDGDPGCKVEIYDRGRFAYLTGHALEPARPIAERQRLVTLLAQHVRPLRAATQRGAQTRDDAPIPEGQRNDALFRVARGFVRLGLRGTALEAALRAVNARRCIPPLPISEVVKLAQHAERLPDRRPA